MKLTCPIMINDSKVLLEQLRSSRRIYDQALYYMRQAYFKTKEEGKIKTYSYNELYDLVKDSSAFVESKLDYVAKQYSIKQVFNGWKAFIKATIDYKVNSNKYQGRPKILRYLYKTTNYNVLNFDRTRFSKKGCKENEIKIPQTNYKITIPSYINKDDIKQIRILKFYDKTKIEIVYEIPDKEIKDYNSSFLGIDIGLYNICAITTNDKLLSYVIKGGPLKSINQYFNKKKSFLQERNNKKDLLILSRKHKNKIDNYMHWCSRQIIDLCLKNNIDNIVIGHNKGWKQEIQLGKRNNQNFVSIPFNRLIDMIKYKAQKEGLNTIVVEETYTSKVDHLALEPLCKQETYSGQRIKRGLFKSGMGKIINADINGAIGILRKANGILDEELLLLQDRGDVVSPKILKKVS